MSYVESPVRATSRSTFSCSARRVVSLADDVVAEGAFAADVNVTALPAGVYLVRAVVRVDGNAAHVAVARLTVAR